MAALSLPCLPLGLPKDNSRVQYHLASSPRVSEDNNKLFCVRFRFLDSHDRPSSVSGTNTQIHEHTDPQSKSLQPVMNRQWTGSRCSQLLDLSSYMYRSSDLVRGSSPQTDFTRVSLQEDYHRLKSIVFQFLKLNKHLPQTRPQWCQMKYRSRSQLFKFNTADNQLPQLFISTADSLCPLPFLSFF